MNIEILITLIIAIYGAALSTFVFIFNIYKYRSDSGKLKLECEIEKYKADEDEQEEEGVDIKKRLVYLITNIGKRQVLVTAIGATFPEGGGCEFVNENLPKMLQPGEFVEEIYNKFLNIEGEIDSVYVQESTGKRYFLNIEKIPRFLSA